MPLKLKARGKGKTYWIIGSLLGECVRESTRTSERRIAEALLIKRSKDIEQQTIHGSVVSFTFAEAMEFYIRRTNPKGRQAKFLSDLLEYWGKWRCQDITSVALVKYEKIRFKKKVCNNSLRRSVYGPMSAVLRMAAENGLCPPVLLAKPKAEKRRVMPAPEGHISALLRCEMDKWVKACLLIMTYHGTRPSDLQRLRWGHVQFSNGALTLVQTKNGKPQTIQVHPEAWDALISHFADAPAPLNKDAPVFSALQSGEPANNINYQLRVISKKNGLPYYSTHKLGRHAFASRLLMAGYTLKDVQVGGNWASISVVADLYGHLERSHVDQIVTGMKISDTKDDQIPKAVKFR